MTHTESDVETAEHVNSQGEFTSKLFQMLSYFVHILGYWQWSESLNKVSSYAKLKWAKWKKQAVTFLFKFTTTVFSEAVLNKTKAQAVEDTLKDAISNEQT